MEKLPVLYVIFTLLNAVRRGIPRRNIWREFHRQRIALTPRLSFWVALCREAGLLSERDELIVTRYARHWLNQTPEEQTFHLIEAWQNAPKNLKVRQFRKKLLWKLQYDQPLTQKDWLALNGLEALGLVEKGGLTAWGRFFIKGEGKLGTPKPVEPCQIYEKHFIAPVPQHLNLLWELEKHLKPVSMGKYPLTKRALRFHSGDPHDLIALLEQGLQTQAPDDIRALILNQPSLRVMDGVILEFSDPADLAALRRQPNFRQHLDEVLSPRHVYLTDQEANRFLPRLKKRGIQVSVHEQPPEVKNKRTHFPQNKLLQPVGKSQPKLGLLEKYRQLGQAIDLLYHAPGCPAEKRRITPLLIEQRGEHTYVTAYCQTRRAQRLFRLDRMEIPGTY